MFYWSSKDLVKKTRSSKTKTNANSKKALKCQVIAKIVRILDWS